MNSIPILQNDEPQLKLLRARTHVYSRATMSMVLQHLLTLVLPVAGAVLAILRPEYRAYVAAASLVAVIVDALILDRQYKLLMKRAAKIAEQFDCTVLDLPWDQFTVGDKVEVEDVHAAARAYAARHDNSKLRGWYPKKRWCCTFAPRTHHLPADVPSIRQPTASQLRGDHPDCCSDTGCWPLHIRSHSKPAYGGLGADHDACRAHSGVGGSRVLPAARYGRPSGRLMKEARKLWDGRALANVMPTCAAKDRVSSRVRSTPGGSTVR